MDGSRLFFVIALLVAAPLLSLAAVAQADDDDVAKLLRTARQLADEQPRQAMRAYRRVLAEAPGHQQAYAALRQLANQHGLSTSPDLLDSLAKEFPSGTHLRTTEHFLIVYDMPHTWADTRARLLEQVHEAFYQQMREAGFQPWPLEQRLVCVLFAEHDDYLAYARRLGTGNMENSGGFYAAGPNRVVFFSNRAHPQLREQGAQLEQYRREVNQLQQEQAEAERRGDDVRAQHLRTRRVRALRALARLENQHNSAVGRTDIVQTAHEAAHLLAFNSGVQRRGRPYPLWVSEGLATAFETTNPTLRFGPAHDNPLRRRALAEAAQSGHLLPLRELVPIRSRHDIREGQANAVYAQVWGLFHYLWNRDRDALRDYMQGLATGRRSAADAEQMLKSFEASFGDIDELDRAYRAWIRQLER